MAPSSPIARLTDIIEVAELIRSELAGVTLQAFEPGSWPLDALRRVGWALALQQASRVMIYSPET